MIGVIWFIIKIIFWILIYSLPVVIFVYALLAFIYKYENTEEQKITYRELVRLIPISPHKWELKNGLYAYAVYTDNNRSTNLYMKSYFDCLRLQCLYNKSKKKSLDIILFKQRAELVKCWQKDINDYQERYMNELKKMRDRIK